MSALAELARPVAEAIWLLEIDAAALALAGEGGASPSVTVTTLRFASRGFTTDALLDVPPSTLVEGRLASAFTVSRELSASADTGFSNVADFSVGELTLENTDRGLDQLLAGCALTGREARVSVAAWRDITGNRSAVAGDAYLWDDVGGASVAWDDGAGGSIPWQDGVGGAAAGGGGGLSALAAFTRVFRGRVSSWSFSGGSVVVRVEPDARKLDSPLLVETYDGTGDLGGATGLSGRTKPRAFGRCLGVEPVQIDPARLIYQVHDGAVAGIPGVRDEGVDLAFVRDYGSYAELRDAVQQSVGGDDGDGGFDLGIGQFATCLLEGVFRVGGPPAGRLVADLNGAAQVADVVQPWADGTYWADGNGWTTRTFVSYASGARHIIQHLLTTDCGFAAGEVDSEGIDHLDGADPDGSLDPSAGLWLPSGDATTGREAVARLAQDAGVVAFQGRDGTWQVRYLAVGPSPVLTLDRSRLVPDSLERLDLPYPQPWSTWKVAWNRNNTPLTATDLAGGDNPSSVVTDDTRAFSLRPAAYAQATDPAIDLLWPQGRTATLETAITNQADALQRVGQMFRLHGRGRGMFRAKWEGVFGAIEFMDIVLVQLPQQGLDAGVPMLVVGLTEDGATRQVETVLFGGQAGPEFQLPPTVWLAQGPTSVVPSTTATVAVSFVVALSSAQTRALRVSWTLSGLAPAAVQGGALAGTATVAAGQTSGTLGFTLAAQTLTAAVAASLKIAAPPGAAIGTPASLGFTVAANSGVVGAAPAVRITSGPASATASSTATVAANVALALSAAGSDDAVVTWSVSGLQAGDVVGGALSGTATIAAGATTATIPFSYQRQLLASSRSGTFALSAVSGCQLGSPGSAAFTLTSNFTATSSLDLTPLGPAAVDGFWRTKTNGDASLTQLATGVTLTGGSQVNRSSNGVALASRVEYGGAYTLTFSTKRTDAATPAANQDELALHLLLGVEGNDPDVARQIAFWTDTNAVPSLATYLANARGLVVPLHLVTSSNLTATYQAAAYWFNHDGTRNAISPQATRSFGNTQNTVYNWTVTKSGQQVAVSQTPAGGSTTTATWNDAHVTRYADKGAVMLVVTSGRHVDVTAFHVTAGDQPSFGGLLAQASLPGRWPTQAVSYGFPDAGFGWINDTHPFGFGSYAALSSSWSPAPAAMRDGFRAAAAAWAVATGIPVTEKSPSLAQVKVAVSNILPGASSLDGIGNPPPNGTLMVSPAIASGSWAKGGYPFHLALSTLGQAAFGLHAPPSTSVVNDYSLTIMAPGAATQPRWWSAPRQADVDAAQIDYGVFTP